ncbi:MAG: beta-ketoacyl-ACP synthase III [Hyphomicrobium sp.]|nr:beta-ketoacyl-ACP synthase III [Hyphomicrobium sp.]
MGSTILSTGHYVPERRVANAEIEARLGLDAGWIERRTGIRERRYAAPEEALSDMAIAAGHQALEKLGFAPSRVRLLVLATSTPDHLLPPTAPLVAHRLGLVGAGAIDMAGACSGFLHALTYADAFVRIHREPVLVIAANILSRRINPEERASSILFADAAGAVVLAPSSRADTGVLGVDLASDGSAYGLIQIPAGGSRKPFSAGLEPHAFLMHIEDGRVVFAKAVEMMATSAERAMVKARISIGDIETFIPHQANARIIAAVERRTGIPPGRTLTSVANYGNSSAATIPLTLSLNLDEAIPRAGTKILLAAAGAGLTGGAIVYGF